MNLGYFARRSCIYKKDHSIISAIYKMIICRIYGIKLNSIYRCIFCGHIHIGHKTKKTDKRLKKLYNVHNIKNKKIFLLTLDKS